MLLVPMSVSLILRREMAPRRFWKNQTRPKKKE